MPAAHRGKAARRRWFLQEQYTNSNRNLLWACWPNSSTMERRLRSYRRRLDRQSTSANSPDCQCRLDNPGRPKRGMEAHRGQEGGLCAHGAPMWNVHKGQRNPSSSVEAGIGSSRPQAVSNHGRTGRNPLQQFRRQRKIENPKKETKLLGSARKSQNIACSMASCSPSRTQGTPSSES